MWNVWEEKRFFMHVGFWWGNFEGKRSLVRHKRRWENIKGDVKKNRIGRTGIGLIWLRIGASGGLL
jgi:hypothetical protein